MPQQTRKTSPKSVRSHRPPQTQPALPPALRALRAADFFDFRKIEVSAFVRSCHDDVRTALTRYAESNPKAADTLAVELRGGAIRNGGTFTEGDGVAFDVSSADAVRTVAYTLLALAAEAERRGLFDGLGAPAAR